VVVIAHRPSALAGIDYMLVMREGTAQSFGEKDEVLRKVLRPPPSVPTPLKVFADANGGVR
jgi:ABC-type protease/lipase transport system fused ATPase/permease subunit